MFFYDPKQNKHFCLTDEEKINIICWADKDGINHIRIVKACQLREHFDMLPTCYSKIIYDPDKKHPWIQYQGRVGNTCHQLVCFIRNLQLTDTKEYVIAYKRFARDVTVFSLPMNIAIHEYTTLRGYTLSKSMVCAQTGKIIESDGPEADQCVKYIQKLLH